MQGLPLVGPSETLERQAKAFGFLLYEQCNIVVGSNPESNTVKDWHFGTPSCTSAKDGLIGVRTHFL